MKRRNVNSFNVLTPEDKKYLRRICRYLASLGMKEGTLEMEVDDGYFDFSDIDWSRETHFSKKFLKKYLIMFMKMTYSQILM
jgi:hypothetical protein